VVKIAGMSDEPSTDLRIVCAELQALRTDVGGLRSTLCILTVRIDDLRNRLGFLERDVHSHRLADLRDFGDVRQEFRRLRDDFSEELRLSDRAAELRRRVDRLEQTIKGRTPPADHA